MSEDCEIEIANEQQVARDLAALSAVLQPRIASSLWEHCAMRIWGQTYHHDKWYIFTPANGGVLLRR